MKRLYATIGLVLLLALACGKDNKNNPSSPGNRSPETQPAITDINTLVGAPDRRTMVGRSVQSENAKVQAVVGTYVFWAGSDTRSSIPVVRLDRMRGPVPEHVKKGDKVRLSGTVRLVSSTTATDPLWEHINENEKRDIDNATVYIAADKVMVVH